MQSRVQEILLAAATPEQGLADLSAAMTPKGEASFDEYVREKLARRLTKASCQSSWTKPTLFVRCLDCEVSKWTAICLDCFVHGNHEGHSAFLHFAPEGCCDCGGVLAMKPECCCEKHNSGRDNDGHVDELTHDEIELFVTAFRGIINHLENFGKDSDLWVIRFANDLVKLGDAVRRCCVVAFQMEGSVVRMVRKLCESGVAMLRELFSWVSSLFNDLSFLYFYSRDMVTSYPEILSACEEMAAQEKEQNKLQMLLGLFFYACQERVLSTLIKTRQINWYDTGFGMLNWLVDSLVQDPSYKNFGQKAGEYLMTPISNILVQGLTDDPDMTRSFAMNFFAVIQKIDMKFDSSRCFGAKFNETDEHERVGAIFSTFLMTMITKLPKAHEMAIELLAQKIKDCDLEAKSVLSADTVLSPFYVLHLFAFHTGSFTSTTLNMLKLKYGIEPEGFVDQPLKWAAAAALSLSNLFVRNPDSFVSSVTGYFFRQNIESRAVPTFALIQTFLGLCSDKQRFLEKVGAVFGLFSQEECDNDVPTIRNIEQTCLHFILCLLYDRICINNDIKAVRRMLVMTHLLHEKNMTNKDIAQLVNPTVFHTKEFRDDFKTYATINHTRTGTYFKFSGRGEWSPLLPFVKLPAIVEAMNVLQSKNPKELVPFPDFIPAPVGIDLLSAARTHFVFGFAFHLLHQFVTGTDHPVSNESLALVLNLLISLTHMFDGLTNPTDETAIFETKLSLLRGMPFSLVAKVIYKDSDPVSMVELVERAGDMGKLAMSKLNMPNTTPEPAHNSREEARRRAMALKQSILGGFKAKQAAFCDELDEEEEEEMECSVCHSKKADDPLVYPCFSFATVIPDIVRNGYSLSRIPQTVVGFHACTHAFHKSCVRNRGTFRCPVDRCVRNCLLTKSDSYETNVWLNRCDHEFLVAAFADGGYEKGAIRALAGEIYLMDARGRLRPDALDKPACQDMCRYLYMLLWRCSTIEYQYDRQDATQHLLFALLFSETPVEDVPRFQKLVQDVARMPPTELELWEFLRCAAIIQHFVLRMKLSTDKLIDWDEELSFTSLIARYDIYFQSPRTDLELQTFKFCDLPQNFLHFIKPPYSCDMSQSGTNYGICILTGKLVNLGMRAQQVEGSYPNVKAHIKTALGGGFTIVVPITGRNAGGLEIVFGQQPYACSPLRSIYVDELGDEDRGFSRGEILYLSNECVSMAIESLLSSEWTDSVKENQPFLLL